MIYLFLTQTQEFQGKTNLAHAILFLAQTEKIQGKINIVLASFAFGTNIVMKNKSNMH